MEGLRLTGLPRLVPCFNITRTYGMLYTGKLLAPEDFFGQGQSFFGPSAKKILLMHCLPLLGIFLYLVVIFVTTNRLHSEILSPPNFNAS